MPNYVNKPGGVIVHMKDGSSEGLSYGDPIPDGIADYVDVSSFSDDVPRRIDADEQQVRDAKQRAALADSGQPNSSSSPVPSNYPDLDEDTVVQIVRNLEGYPGSQAAILLHEKLYGEGRQRIFDAASDAGRVQAALELAQLAPATEAAAEEPKDAPSDDVDPAKALAPSEDDKTAESESGDGDKTGEDPAPRRSGGRRTPPTS
jgi:hypothetical protein